MHNIVGWITSPSVTKPAKILGKCSVNFFKAAQAPIGQVVDFVSSSTIGIEPYKIACELTQKFVCLYQAPHKIVDESLQKNREALNTRSPRLAASCEDLADQICSLYSNQAHAKLQEMIVKSLAPAPVSEEELAEIENKKNQLTQEIINLEEQCNQLTGQHQQMMKNWTTTRTFHNNEDFEKETKRLTDEIKESEKKEKELVEKQNLLSTRVLVSLLSDEKNFAEMHNFSQEIIKVRGAIQELRNEKAQLFKSASEKFFKEMDTVFNQIQVLHDSTLKLQTKKANLDKPLVQKIKDISGTVAAQGASATLNFSKEWIEKAIRSNVLIMMNSLARQYPDAADHAGGLLLRAANAWLAFHQDRMNRKDIPQRMAEYLFGVCFPNGLQDIESLQLSDLGLTKDIYRQFKPLIIDGFAGVLPAFINSTLFIRSAYEKQTDLKLSLREKSFGFELADACAFAAKEIVSQAFDRIGSISEIVEEINTAVFAGSLSKAEKKAFVEDLEKKEIKKQLTGAKQLFELCRLRRPSLVETAELRRLLKGYYKRLSKIAITTKTCAELICPQDIFSQVNKNFVDRLLNDAAHKRGAGFVLLSSHLEAYAETLVLKVVNELMSLDNKKMKLIGQWISDAKEKLNYMEFKEEINFIDEENPFYGCKDENAVMEAFGSQLFILLNLSTKGGEFFGLPKSLGKKLSGVISGLICGSIVKQWDDFQEKITLYNNKEDDLNKIVPRVKAASTSLIAFGQDYLKQEDKKGKKIVLFKINSLLGGLEDIHPLIPIFKRIITKPLAVEFFNHHLNLIGNSASAFYNNAIVVAAQKFAQNKISDFLQLYIGREKKEKRKIERAILNHGAELLSKHLEFLNNARAIGDGSSISIGEYIKAVGANRHAAIVNENYLLEGLNEQEIQEEKSEQAINHFYAKKLETLVKIFLTHGKEDLDAFLPHLSPLLIDFAWENALNGGAKLISSAPDDVFTKEMAENIFLKILEAVEKKSKQPISIAPSFALSDQEKKELDAFSKKIGALVLQLARYFGVPLEMLGTNIPFFNRVEGKIEQLIGSVILEQFNGELLEKLLIEGLDFLKEMKFEENKGPQESLEAKMNRLEKTVIKEELYYPFKWLKTYLEHKIEGLSDTVLRDLLEISLTVCVLLCEKLATFLKLIGAEALTVYLIHGLVRYVVNQISDVWSRGELHQNTVFQAADMIEEELKIKNVFK